MAGIKTVTASTNTLLAGLKRTETQWDASALTYHIAVAGDKTDIDEEYQRHFGSAPTAGNPFQPLDSTVTGEANLLAAIQVAMDAYALVSGYSFTAATDLDSADVVWSGGYATLGASNPFARFDSPAAHASDASATDLQSYYLGRVGDDRMERSPETGGGSFGQFVILHEFGHGLGLSHPHNDDRGTTAWSVSSTTSTDNKADNSRYTVMSYELGGIDGRFYNTPAAGSFGHNVTPGALDIAAIQETHGTAAAYTGNTTYNLTDQGTTALDVDGTDGTVSIGRAFYTIWDTGGTDKIAYSGSKNAYINLNEATLVQEESSAHKELVKQIKKTDAYDDMKTNHGDGTTSQPLNELEDADYHAGGFFSTLSDASGTQMGGYSIASGVTVEDATSGAGKDVLIGNNANNTLMSGAEADLVAGSGGDDTIDAGAGDDEIIGGGGNDNIDGGDGMDTAYYSGPCSNYEITKDETTGVVTIKQIAGTGDGTDTLVNVEKAKFLDSEKDLTADEIEDCPPLDFIFLVDLSGSFADDLANFQAAAREVAADLRDENPDVRFAIASFVDKPESPFGAPGDYLYKPELALTDSVADFESALDGLRTFSGGDGPEAQWVGLWRAANGIGLNLREDSSRLIYMATDATAHDAADYGLDETTIKNFLETEGVTTTSLPGQDDEVTETAPVVQDTDGSDDGLDVTPVERPAGDPGTDTGATVTRPTDDAMLSEIDKALSSLGATPIIGVSGSSKSDYDEALADFGKGITVETSSDSSDVADAIRAGIASLSGEVTETGTAGPDTMTGTENRDVFLGLGGNDTISGLGGDDDIDGGADDDELSGGDGNDDIEGGSGNDVINAGAGDDDVNPGAGTDTMTLGAGKDEVKGTAAALFGDTVTDMTSEDSLVFEEVVFARSALTVTEGSAIIGVDTDGDGTSDGSVTLEGTFTGGEFMVAKGAFDTTVSFESYLPTLSEGTALAAASINGINNQAFLTGNGTSGFRVTLNDSLADSWNNNPLGVYEIDASGNIVDARILFGGTKDSSASVDVTGVEAGNKLGFFIIRNNDDNPLDSPVDASSSLGFVNSTTGTAANISDGANIALQVGGSTIDQMVFHSFDASLNSDSITHAVSGVNAGGASITVGFEDKSGGGDNDFQDVVFTVDTLDFV